MFLLSHEVCFHMFRERHTYFLPFLMNVNRTHIDTFECDRMTKRKSYDNSVGEQHQQLYNAQFVDIVWVLEEAREEKEREELGKLLTWVDLHFHNTYAKLSIWG